MQECENVLLGVAATII